jgi:ATP-dependent RNA helicase SUPV3L1/SUV3
MRLARWVADVIARDLAPLFAAEAAAGKDPALRGPLHRIVEAGGVVPGYTEHDIAPALRGRLKALGVRAGRFALFLPAALKPRAQATRAALWAIWARVVTPALPAPGLVSVPPPPDWPPGFAAAMGWLPAGPVLLRLDVAERIAAELAYATRFRAAAVPDGLASRLSVRADAVPAALRALGVRLAPGAVLESDQYGPPSPPMMLPGRRRDHAAPTPPARSPRAADGPFAALVALRR